MRKRIKQFFKRSLAGIAALAMAVGSVSGLPVQAKGAESVAVTDFTSRIPGEIVLENAGGDNLVLLQSLSAEDEFVFGADVTFTNPDEQQSAALIFGIRDNNLDDGHAIKANIHKKIDWNVPARVWGYGTDELRCPGENGQANRFFEDNRIDVTQKFRMEVSVQKNSDNKYVLTYSLTNTDGEKVTVAEGILKDSYTGGRFGLMTFASRAIFSNITVDGQKYGALETEAGAVTVHGVNGDAHIVSDVRLEREQGFTYETDMDLAADTCSAALTFGIQNKDNPGEAWIGANFNFNDHNGAGGARVFRVQNGAADIGSASLEGKLDRSKTIHVKLHVSSTGLVTYELYNTDNPENKVIVSGTLSDYQGGYLGLLTFDSSAVFTNTTYTLDEAIPADTEYKTNLGELTYAGGSGTWIMTENGLYSDATGQGDCFAFSEVQGTNFVYATEIDFDGTEGAAALVFRSNRDLGNKECYAFNIDVGSHRCKFWRWQRNDALQLIDEREVPATADEKYTLKVVAYDSWILCYVNDRLVASTGDYVLQPGNRGQNTVLKEGCFGILNWNSKVTFQNTYYQELSEDFNPLLTDISVTSDLGTVEEKTQFTPTEPITLQYVRNDAATVNIEVARASKDAVVEVRDANGTVYADGKNIPVEEGSNDLTVTSTVTAEDGMTAAVVYRVNVHRFKADEIYYNEAYRDQYHYSVKEGWANDPNGLVYFNGTYHMFYQFYDDIKWGPMHWAHATSADLIHWQEEPIALYPDANGAMYSGCIVVDAHNTSGFFDGIQGGGLVALITADGNGERIKLAYSTDEGKTWTKVDEIAADWTDDPLQDAAFRDPKVFRWEGKWFMVVAGGPLRIYSSDDLKHWTCEAAYPDLHTECPDLYPIEAPDGQIKWVLSRGGRFYKVGDFKSVDGSWCFVPDADYVSRDGVMNFGRDSYAAMTYYVQDFGTAANPTLPELVELNWMNTWDDYCNQVAEKVGQDFNGTFNLNLKLCLLKDGEQYVLTQTPISAYEALRQTDNKQEWTQVTVEENNTLLKDFVGDTYEIIAKFYPEEGTRKVGFRVRAGVGEETLIVYDLEGKSLSIDRSRSGVIISGKFAEVTSQHVTENADGTVDLHIYVDKASVEVFAKDYTAAGAAQIFPSPLSVGAGVIVEGAAAKADITIYPLESIWTDRAEVTEPQYIGSTSAARQNLYVGDTLKLHAYVLPTTVSQEVAWSVKEGHDVAAVDATGTVTGLQKGTAVIVAASVANPELTKEFTIQVTENNFQTNIPAFVNVNGNWIIDDETLSVSNGGQNDYYMSAETIEGDFVLETDIRYTRGLINLFLASEQLEPHAGAGAYTIQFGYDTNVRLFPFGKDDYARGTMERPINDGEYHHVKVIKDGQKLVVYVDDAKCLEHTFEEVEAFFAKGHVGIGLWDGALDVQNFFVNPLEDEVSLIFDDVTSEEQAELDALLAGEYQEHFAGFDRDAIKVKLIAERYDGTTYEIYDEVRSFVLPYPEGIEESRWDSYDFVVLRVNQGSAALVSFEATKEGLALNSVPGCFVIGYVHVCENVDCDAAVTPPTCTEQGYTTYTCRICGKSHTADFVDALGHTASAAVKENEVAPDCVTAGSYDAVICCTVCGEELSRETVTVPALGHTEEVIPAVEATCTKTGLTEGKKCAVCGEILVAQEEIPALGHDWHGTGCSRCDEKRENPFVDVPEDSFYIDPVLWAVEKGITNGTTDTTFDPNGTCVRAHVVTFLWRAAGEPEPNGTTNPFTDVQESDFFYKAVLWAVEKGITNGTTATTFSPYTECNRAQVITFLYRAAGSPAVETSGNPFADVPAGEWFTAPILWALGQGITTGVSETAFGPNAICNRAQTVTFLYRTFAN